MKLLEVLSPLLDKIQHEVIGQRVTAMDDGESGTVKMVRFHGDGFTELLVDWDKGNAPTWVDARDIRWQV